MLTNSDRTVLYGVMAFIAYQLYQQRKCACGVAGGGGAFGGGANGNGGSGSGCVSPAVQPRTGSSMVAPEWVQQLSNVGGSDFFTPRCGMWGRCS